MHKSSFQFTDPIHHENLKIQFLLGPSTPPEYLTLAEGCLLRIIKVLETGTVGRLTIHNHSPKKPLFIQLGELLNGGLQDRTIATDLILAGREIRGTAGILRRTRTLVQATRRKPKEIRFYPRFRHNKAVTIKSGTAGRPNRRLGSRSFSQRQDGSTNAWLQRIDGVAIKPAIEFGGFRTAKQNPGMVASNWRTISDRHENRGGSNHNQRASRKDRLVRAHSIVSPALAGTFAVSYPRSFT